MGPTHGICHHRAVTLSLSLAQQSGYLLAGVLTVAAAVIVTVVIVLTSRSGGDGGEGR